MAYIALIADIVSSRKLKNRNEVQQNLSNKLNSLNSVNKSIISPYTITLGDEFQALYSNSSHIFNDVFTIFSSLYPIKIRFSFGIGSILTEINHENSLGMDGPAFHLARDGIEELKKSPNRFIVSGISGNVENLINQSLAILSIESNKWKESRVKIFDHYLQNKSVKEMSKGLALSEQAIYKSIKSGKLDIFKSQLIEIENLISKVII